MKDNKMISSKNEFVKREQAVMKSMMGDRPGVPAEMRKFNAYMSNNEATTEACVKSCTEGLDKRAFPVK